MAAEDGWRIELDGRPARTPKRADLVVPTAAVCEAIVAEWAAQGARIDPRTMPFTGLANAAIDIVGPDPHTFAAKLAAYAESDLVCYRAASPAGLAARHVSAWEPFVDFARRRHDAALRITTGSRHIAQDAGAVGRLAAAVNAMDRFRLAAMQPLVTLSGSLVIALAVAARAVDAQTAFAAGHVDELYQIEKWGEDAEACAALDARRTAFTAAARFLDLL